MSVTTAFKGILLVGTERLELSHLTALASKTSVSTNFTTSPWQENKGTLRSLKGFDITLYGGCRQPVFTATLTSMLPRRMVSVAVKGCMPLILAPFK